MRVAEREESNERLKERERERINQREQQRQKERKESERERQRESWCVDCFKQNNTTNQLISQSINQPTSSPKQSNQLKLVQSVHAMESTHLLLLHILVRKVSDHSILCHLDHQTNSQLVLHSLDERDMKPESYL